MYKKLAINDFTIRQAPFPERFAIARKAGFTGIEFQIEEARNYAKQQDGLESVLALLQRNELRFDQAMILRDCFSPGHCKNRTEFISYAESLFRDTQYLKGDVVLACTTFGPADIKSAPEMFAELCDTADAFGIKLALEFIGWAETIKDIRTAWSIVEKAGRKNGGILYDTLHHYFGGSSLRDLEELPSRYIFTVHIADANDLDLPGIDIGRKHRLFPGQGVIPIVEILGILNDKGYSSPMALEIFNDELLKRPAIDVAREGYEYMINALTKAGFGEVD
jgi:sugar phosphate isomerase/epimerase